MAPNNGVPRIFEREAIQPQLNIVCGKFFSSDSEKKGLHFESVSDFIIFVPKMKCSQKNLYFESISDFIIFVSEANDLEKKSKIGVREWNRSLFSGGISTLKY